MDRTSVDRAAALLSYPIAYIYFYWFMTNWYPYAEPRLVTQWAGHFLFSVLFVLAVEVYAGIVYRSGSVKDGSGLVAGDTALGTVYRYSNASPESVCLAALLLLQSLALLIYGPHADDLAVAQVLFWHFTCIYYVCARTGILTAGRTGVFFLWDAVNGTFVVPFRHIFLRLLCLLRRKKGEKTETGTKDNIAAELQQIKEEHSLPVAKLKNAAVFSFTVIFAVIVCGIAWNELAGVSEAFGKLGQRVAEFVAQILSFEGMFEFLEEYLPYVIFSIPIGAYLFGLVGGGLSDKPAAARAAQDAKMREGLEQCRILPAYSAYVVLGGLLAVYLLFFGVQTAELIDTLSGNSGTPLHELVGVQEACQFAVGGFWQLVRVILLNFAVLLGFTLLAKKPLWEEKCTRILIDLIFVCAVAFAMLAGFKLFVLYFYQYGPTPRRILSGWLIVMQLLWCVLTLIRFHRNFPAVRIGVYTGAISFTALMLLDIEKICGYM